MEDKDLEMLREKALEIEEHIARYCKKFIWLLIITSVVGLIVIGMIVDMSFVDTYTYESTTPYTALLEANY